MAQQFTAQLHDAAVQPAHPEPVEGLHAQVIDQVVREVSLHRIDEPNGAGRSDIVVRLDPPNLGSLRLQVTQETTDHVAAAMTTHIQASSSQVRGLLEAHLPLLIDSLARAGVRMDSVSVSTGASFNAFAGNAQQQPNAQPNANHTRQQLVPSSQPIGIDTIAASQFGGATSRQAGYSWLA
jgi:flagellar hook-length control protein FliK